MSKKTKILLANDDGIDAPGIQALYAEIKNHYDVLVVAPMYEKSGAGCSLSLSNEMQVQPRIENGKTWGYAVNGTPADCVKFALTALDGYRPDLVLSGINRGMNLGNSVFYSGTVAAAIEGTLYGLPAMATSLACWGHPVPFYEDAAKVVRSLIPWLISVGYEPRTLWNLNMPNKKMSEHSRIVYTTHGTSFFEDVFELFREEGDSLYYRNIGQKLVECATGHQQTDDRAIINDQISLSLLRTDLTIPLSRAAVQGLEERWSKALESSR